MPAYIVIDRLAVTDADRFGPYADGARAALEQYGGRYIFPSETRIEALEGNWAPDRIVLIEFEDVDQARRFWDSAEYAGPRALHHAATISNIILLDGDLCRRTAEPAVRSSRAFTTGPGLEPG